MPDVAPNRLHISRHYGLPFLRASRTEDGRLVPAGLLAHGSDASLDLPSGESRPPVVFATEACRLQLRAQPRDRRLVHLTVFPLHLRVLAHAATPSRPLERLMIVGLSTQISQADLTCVVARRDFAAPWPERSFAEEVGLDALDLIGGELDLRHVAVTRADSFGKLELQPFRWIGP